MFIVIDGIDGSGKTTQTQLLKTYFESLGKRVKIFDFPRYTEASSFFVQKFLNAQYKNDLDPKLISSFFALDRFDASNDVYESLFNYDIVIANRYVSSNMIHQTAKMLQKKSINFFDDEIHQFITWVDEFEYQICKIPKPDKVFLLDVPPEFTQKLLNKKEQRSYILSGNKDINEKDFDHQKKAYIASLLLLDLLGWERVDCLHHGELLSSKQILSNLLDLIGHV